MKWHPYLIIRHLKVRTYHVNLKYFLEQRLSSKQQQKWVTNMLGYDFEIIYKKRKIEWVAIALSRKEGGTEGLLCDIYIMQYD